MNVSTDNPIELRLQMLYQQWNDFARLPKARVLRWLADSNEVRMIEAFVAMESHDEAGHLPVMFVRFIEPFQDPRSYSEQLQQSLQTRYDELKPSLEEDDIAAAWQAPRHASPSATSFVRMCHSFFLYYQARIEQFAVFLSPPEIHDAKLWQTWLEEAAKTAPSQIRIVVIDPQSNPLLEQWSLEQPELVCTQVPRLHMEEALHDLANSQGSSNDPGVQFRTHFLALSTAAGKADLAQAKPAGKAALAIASREGWRDLEVAVYAALGAACLAAGQPKAALAEYQKADEVGQAMVLANDPLGIKLRLQAQLSLGAAWIAADDFSQAANVYVQAAPLAEQVKDLLLHMECWRMASFCYEQQNYPQQAWEYGWKALDIGKQMEPAARNHSTLAYAGEGLLRLSQQPAYAPYRNKVEATMSSLLARRDWHPSTPMVSKPTA